MFPKVIFLGMARRHWLDPLARQLLRLTGSLPSAYKHSSFNNIKKETSVDIELEAIKKKQKNPKHITSFLVDVNRASASDWLKLPGCTEQMIELLLRLQRGGVQLSGKEDLAQLLEIPEDIAEQWAPHLLFCWYGDSPPLKAEVLIDLNSAHPTKLAKILNWPEGRLKRLVRERQRRTFDNLADFQERLSLPASTIEKLIGLVCFGSKPAGPILPPKV